MLGKWAGDEGWRWKLTGGDEWPAFLLLGQTRGKHAGVMSTWP